VKAKRWVSALVAGAGIAVMVLAVEIRAWHGRGSWTGEPAGKSLIASWQSSEMWVNPLLLAVGAAILVLALVLILRGRRPANG
jgi:hypothetical protein